jgi:hypothetical protein
MLGLPLILFLTWLFSWLKRQVIIKQSLMESLLLGREFDYYLHNTNIIIYFGVGVNQKLTLAGSAQQINYLFYFDF